MSRSSASEGWNCKPGVQARVGPRLRVGLVLLVAQVCVSRGLSQEPPNFVHPLPPQAPPWVDGYQIRWPIRTIGDLKKLTAQSVVVSLPTGGWLKPDASDLVVQTAHGKILPHFVLCSDPTGETVIQFQRNGEDPWYWVCGLNPQAPAKPNPGKPGPAFQEGVTLELREWAGDDITSWAKVRPGLDKSTKVIGNAIVGEVVQYSNPARPVQPHKFAASYRGFLDIKKPGNYRFIVNADDASFLFIDGFKVFERAGVNKRLAQLKVKEIDKLCGTVDLKLGVHTFEVHQVIGTNPDAQGVCALLWSPPGEAKFTYVLAKDIKHPVYARAAAIERKGGQPGAALAYGIDDTLDSGGLKLFIVRFEAQGEVLEDDKLLWDFGDGTSGKGRSVRHVYFKEGDYVVALQSGPGLPPFRRTVNVWPEPGETSPLSLELAVKTLEEMDWRKLGKERVREIFAFLSICEQPNRWALQDQVAQFLLDQKEDNLDFKSQLYTAKIDALTHLGRADEALKLAAKVQSEFNKTPALQVRIQLAVAAMHQYHFKDARAASKIYKDIIDAHSRTEHPFLRLAGIRWGDLFAEAGDLVRAGETYRMAATLGGEKFLATAQTEATTRGALLRIAEQKLRAGEIYATRQLLERIELNYPGQRIDGLYCFLRADADRHAGRYEDALRYYEMLLKLPQWAGYRDRAVFGIADTYFRMEELEKSQKWLADLKEAFPKFYEQHKVAETEKILEARLGRIKDARAQGRPTDAFFKGYSTGFEPDEPEAFGTPNGFPVVTVPGIQGPHGMMIDVFPQDVAMYNYTRPVKNLVPGKTYWVEIWCKDIVRPAPSAVHQQAFLHFYLSPEKSPPPDVLGSANWYPNTHQWHKLGTKLKAPLAQDFLLKVYFYNMTGIILADALTIRPMTDRQIDALASFYEGPKGP
jgi:tetratricopeptide (TPR) repeat protein